MKESRKNRREFLRILITGAAALPVGGVLLSPAPVRAQDAPVAPRLPEDDPAAFALGYVHDAADVDVSKYPRYEPGQICANCQQWRADPDVEWAPCAIFPGRSVRNAGWCSVWVPVAR
jgi:hypothetical protein